MINKDFLWNGIPAVFYKNKYIIFSPYAKKITSLTKQELSNKKIFEKLKKQKFFGNPKRKVDDRLTITLYLTPDCNLNCIYCFDDCGESSESCTRRIAQKQFMSPDRAIELLKKVLKNYDKFIPNKKIKLRIHYFGGEPTLKFDTIKKVVEFLEKKKINTIHEISTNLVTSKEKIDYMILKKFHFAISCDGPPKINNKQRPFKYSSNVGPSKHLEKIIKHLTKNNAKIRTKVVVTEYNLKQMPEIVEYLVSLGVNHIRLEPFLLDGRAEVNGLKSVNPEIFVKYFLRATKTATKLTKKYDKRIWVSNWAISNLFEPKDFFCNITKGNRIAIMPNGIISKCVRNLHSDESSPFIVGKINNEIKINNNKIKALKNFSVDNMPQCKNCFAKYICSGNCPNENLTFSGNFNIPAKHKCEIAKKLIKALIIKMHENSKHSSPS